MDKVGPIVGIDPGTQRVGYAVLSKAGANWQLMDSGVFQLPLRLTVPQRLALLYDEVVSLLCEHRAQCLVVEEPYVRPFGMRSALVVAQSVGVVKLAGAKAGVEVVSYPYTQAKRALTGSGAAPKEVLNAAVQNLLRLPHLPPWQDAIDALAFALCHCLLAPAAEVSRNP